MSWEKEDYNDIIHLPHPVSKKHPQMELIDPLHGYEAISEKEDGYPFWK